MFLNENVSVTLRSSIVRSLFLLMKASNLKISRQPNPVIATRKTKGSTISNGARDWLCGLEPLSSCLRRVKYSSLPTRKFWL